PKSKLLLVAGLHGDEHEVIAGVEQALDRYKSQLPSFVFIPAMSPSAVVLKTRQNGEGLDLNRQFFGNTQSSEAKAIMERLNGQSFALCVSFHEDLAGDKFYFYDSQDMEGAARLANLRQSIRAAGVELLTGIDDTEDICLGFEFKDGYKVCLPAPDHRLLGTFEAWALTSGLAHRVHGIEVPGKISLEKKQAVVEAVFKHLLI
ncbi:MAG: succinylglutamate desuccinylase/aspartoacylase family protein, partial [bacterium]|nr:succinylglutamate desuccinylase/aspartoacylase family protein [bacterium]